MANLYLMCGVPGSGKSTWIKNHLGDATYVSRDVIRFNLLEEGDEYFSKEDEVWAEFIRRINESLELGFNVFVDATHISRGSRRKILKEVKFNPTLIAIYMDTPFEICLERNAKRTGRECVPEGAIRNMYKHFEEPEFYEGFSIIYKVKPDNKIEIYRREVDL